MANKTFSAFYGETVAASLAPSDIAAAITAAGANSIVRLPAGTGTLTAALVPLAGQTIVGAGRRATILQLPSAVTYSAINASAADVTIRDLTIDGNRAAQTVDLSTGQNAGVYATAARCTVERVRITGTRGMGVGAYSAPDLKIIDCDIEGGHTSTSGTTGGVYKGVYVQGSARPVIRNCRLSGWSQAVGLWFGVYDGQITNCRIFDNFGFEDAGHTVYRSACEDYGAGTTPHGRNVWQGNTVDGSTSKCFEIAQGVVGSKFVGNILMRPGLISGLGSHWEVTGATGQDTTDILIQGNYCLSDASHNDGNTINSNAFRIRVADNHFVGYSHSSVNAPVFLGGVGTPEDVVITGNQFSGCRGGVWLNANGNGIVVANNTFRETTAGNAIYSISGGEHLIQGNRITTTSGSSGGIQVAASGGRHKIIGNFALVYGGSAIAIALADCLVLGNECQVTNSVTGAISLSGASCLRNTVRDNTCRSNNRAIYIVNSADYNVVIGNKILTSTLTVDGTAGTHNTVEPNDSATVTKAFVHKLLAANTVGVAQATIAHGLGYTPTDVRLTMTSAGTIWQSAVADGTNIYLTADAAARTCDAYVR